MMSAVALRSARTRRGRRLRDHQCQRRADEPARLQGALRRGAARPWRPRTISRSGRSSIRTPTCRALEVDRQDGARSAGRQVHARAAEDEGRMGQVAGRHGDACRRPSSAARAALKPRPGPAEASLTQPGQPALDRRRSSRATLVSKDVTLNAEVEDARRPDREEDARRDDSARRVGTLDGAQRRASRSSRM